MGLGFRVIMKNKGDGDVGGACDGEGFQTMVG